MKIGGDSESFSTLNAISTFLFLLLALSSSKIQLMSKFELSLPRPSPVRSLRSMPVIYVTLFCLVCFFKAGFFFYVELLCESDSFYAPGMSSSSLEKKLSSTYYLFRLSDSIWYLSSRGLFTTFPSYKCYSLSTEMSTSLLDSSPKCLL